MPYLLEDMRVTNEEYTDDAGDGDEMVEDDDLEDMEDEEEKDIGGEDA